MALKFHNISYSFEGGLDEAAHAFLQEQGFRSLDFWRPGKTGSVELEPPPAKLSFSGGVVRALGGFTGSINGHDARPVKRGDQYGYVVNGALVVETGDTLRNIGRVSPWVVDQRVIGTVRALSFSLEEPAVEPLAYTPRIDACLSGDFTYLVAEDPNGFILVREIYTETGQIVREYEVGAISIYPAYKPRVAPHGSGVRVYFLIADYLYFVDISGGFVYSPTEVGHVRPDTEYDVLPGGVCAYVVHSEGNIVAVYDNGVVHESDSLPMRLRGVALPVGWTSSTSWLVVAWGRAYTDPEQDHPAQVVGTLQIGASDRAYADFDEFPEININFDIPGFRVDSVGACLGPDNTVFVTVHHPNVSSNSKAGGQFTEPAPWTRLYQVAINDGAPLGVARRCNRVRPVSKPWYDAERETVHFMAAHASGARFEVTDDNRYFVVLQAEFGAGDTGLYPMAHFAQERAEPCLQSNATELQQPNVQPCTPLIDNDGNVALIGLEREPGVGLFRVVRYSLNADDRVGQHVQFGASTYIVGGLLTQWDARGVREAGFLTKPKIVRWDVTPGSTSNYYTVTWARISASGELLRSRPQTPVEISHNGTPPVLYIDAFGPTLSGERVFLEVWRTNDGTSEPFYLLHRREVNTRTPQQEQVDVGSIPSWQGEPVSLASTGQAGEELPNDPPVSPVSIVGWKDRIWLADSYGVYYSKVANDFRQAEFSLLQRLDPPDGPPVEALGVAGQGLVLLTRGGVYIVYGDGADATGAGASLSPPVLLDSRVQIAAPGAVLSGWRDSCVFQADTGLYAVNSGGSVERISDPVENLSRLVDESGRVVRCIAADRDDALYVIFSGPGTPVYRFDARTKVWSFLSYPGGPTRRLEDRLVGEWPTIYELPREVVVGVGAEYPSQPSLSTPWIRVAGEAGEMRIRKVWLLHEGFPPARLRMSVGYDYSDSTTELGEWKVSATERVKRFVLPRQRCRAVRFIIQAVEDEDSEATHPVSLVALRVEVAPRRVAGALPDFGV